MSLYAGLMSGTSLDGVDAVLAEWSTGAQAKLLERGFVHLEMPGGLRSELLALNGEGGNELHRAALAGNALAEVYALALKRLLHTAGVDAAEVRAAGAHGQTVRHRPREFDGTGYTIQLLNGALLAERSGIDIACDFRARDIAAGGQGAPLVPAFHAEVFRGDAGEDVAVLNLGGIANLTLLPGGDSAAVRGFDCGPGNLLLDLWSERHFGRRFDDGGRIAATGRVDIGLLQCCLADTYFERAPPKSTGRDLFDARWLDACLAGRPAGHATRSPADVMATLTELTAAAACQAIARHAPRTRHLLVCGGGSHNQHLTSRLAVLAGPGVAVESTATRGIAPDRVEALAFAWLARAFCERRPGNLAAVTGAAGPRVLGAMYPA